MGRIHVGPRSSDGRHSPPRLVWSRRASFWVSLGVAMHTLWTSAAPALSYRLYAEEWQLSPIQTTGVFAIYPLFVVGTLIFLGDLSDPLRGANHRIRSSGLGPRHTKGSPRLLRVVRNFGTNVA